MNFEWTVTLGQALPIIMTVAGLIGAGVLGWFVNRVKKALLAEWTELVNAFKASTDASVADTNRRVTDLAAGVSQLRTEVAEFKQHVERHYVEKNEIAELKMSFDRSIDRMQQSLEVAIATMGDVRDSVIILTAKGSKVSVPPARRRTATAKATT